jgi:hypothetical protein
MEFDPRLKQVSQRSALGEWLNEENHQIDRPFRFRVRRPLVVDEISLGPTSTLLRSARVIELLHPLDRLPANPEQIQAILLHFFAPRGITPKIDVRLDDVSPPQVVIIDTTRIARLLLPADLQDIGIGARIAYNALPRRAYKAFPRKSSAAMPGTLAPGAEKREIDLAPLLARGATGTPASLRDLPRVDAAVLADVQQRLIQLGFTASLFEHDPGQQLMDLVIDRTTPQSSAASESNGLLGTSATAPSEPKGSSRPNAVPDEAPAPLIPVPKQPMATNNTPQREQKHFIGGGVEYRPGQGVRGLGSFQRKNTFGSDLTQVNAGGMGEGFGSAQYTRDYLFFDALGRRLTVNAKGGTDFVRQRVLNGVMTDERRTGGSAAADLELFRDGPDNQLNLLFEGRKESVSLTPSANPDVTAKPNQTLTVLDVGAAYQWRRVLALHPLTIRLEPTVRVGLPVGGAAHFARFQLGTRYHQLVAGPIEAESRFEWRRASDSTPVFEQPSLGGMESVRGFRADERIGLHLWSWQNELWFPIARNLGQSKWRDFIVRNVRLAGLYDVGRADAPDDLTRYGAGAGLRIRYQGVIIEADWAYGFGNDEAQRPGRGRFNFNFRLP